MAAVDVLTATATQLSQRLQAGSLTSVDLVQAYLAQIEKHNHAGLGLRALIAVHPPTALGQAADRDRERAQGRVRSPLHGIPIIVKDAVITAQSLGLPTTAGAVAFRDTYGKQNAAVIDLLLDQGLIILGKASMTEFCGLKAFCMTAGWSAINGLTQSAWIEGGFRPDDLFIGRSGPGGSSSGSGVGVSAGFAPLSIGTETAGSICMPANRAGLYSMAATRGTIPIEGVFRLSRDFDRLGGMAKCPEDLALLMQVLNGTRAQPAMWADIAVGFVDPLVWNAFQFQKERDEEVEKQILDKYEWARNEIVQRGGRVVYPVELPAMEDLRYEGKSVSHSVAFYEFPGLFQTFCSLLDAPRVTSVPELVEYNEQNAATAMPEPHPDQKDLLDTLHSSLTEETAAAAKAYGHRRAGAEGIDAALEKHQIDLIVGPGDCATCAVAALAGYPTAMLPMSRLEGTGGMGQPQGLMVVGSAGSEGPMLQLMQRWAEVVGPWQGPPLLAKGPSDLEV